MARDLIHYSVKNALIKDGWHISNDPLMLKTVGTRVYVDLEARKFFIATRNTEVIAVEVKTFRSLSILEDFYSALGKYLCYRLLLNDYNAESRLYLGISNVTYHRFQNSSLIKAVIKEFKLKFVIVNIKHENILKWIE